MFVCHFLRPGLNMSCLVGVNGALLLVIITVMNTLKHSNDIIFIILLFWGGGREGGGQVGVNRGSDQCIFCIASLCM